MPTRIISANTTGLYAGDDTDVADAHFKESAPNTNYGSDPAPEITKYGVGDHSNGYLYFDLSGLPAGCTINSVALGINVSARSGDHTLSLFRLLRTVVEGEVTWNVYSTGNAWTAGGGIGDATDRAASAVDSLAIPGTGWNVFDGAGLVTFVQDVVDGTYSNLGLLVERTDGADDSRYMVFISSEGADGNRPYLSVDYTGGTTYNVLYDGNENTGGTAPVDSEEYLPSSNAVALDEGDLVRTGYVFDHWNTAANDSGTSYLPGATVPIVDADVTLYAIWVDYTVIRKGDVTWTCAEMHTHGTFANGDPWVVGPISIVSIEPASTIVVEQSNRRINGSMLNPSVALEQGYDTYMGGTGVTNYYDDALNVARPGGNDLSAENTLDITIGSLMSAISYSALDDNKRVRIIECLTVLNSAPATDAFRPPYVGSDKTILHRVRDIRTSLLPTIDLGVNAPTIATILTHFVAPWIDHIPTWIGKEQMPPPDSTPTYGREFTYYSAAAMLLCCGTEETGKSDLLTQVVQLGIDTYGIAINDTAGDNWVADGGHCGGRLLPILFSGFLMQDSSMLSIADKAGDYAYSGEYYEGNLPPDYFSFAELDQSFYVTARDIARDHGDNVDFIEGDLGKAFWGPKHAIIPVEDNNEWTTDYLGLNLGVWNPTLILTKIFGITNEINHDALIDLIDAWYAQEVVTSYSYNDFIQDVWDDHRHSGDTAPDIPDNLDSSSITETSATISWNSATGARYYKLLRDNKAIYLGPDTSFADSGLGSGVTYDYTVQSINMHSASAETAAISVTTVYYPEVEIVKGSGMSSKIYAQGAVEVSLADGYRLALYSKSQGKIYKKIDNAGNPPIWTYVGILNADEDYQSDAVSGTTSFRIEAGASEVYYNYGTDALIPELRNFQRMRGTILTLNATGDLTSAMILSGLITSSTASAVVGTAPTGETLDSAIQFATGESIDFSIVNTGSETFTIDSATGITLIGNMVVSATSSGRFRLIKTDTATYAIYRLA